MESNEEKLKKIGSFDSINSIYQTLLKRGRALQTEIKKPENKGDKKLQDGFSNLRTLLYTMEENKKNSMENISKRRNTRINGNAYAFLDQLVKFLTKETGENQTKSGTLSFLVLFFYQNFYIKYELRNDRTLSFFEFLESDQVLTNLNEKSEMADINQKIEGLREKIKYIDDQNLKTYYLLLNMGYDVIPEGDQVQISQRDPFNEPGSKLNILDKSITQQVNKHYRTISKKKRNDLT